MILEGLKINFINYLCFCFIVFIVEFIFYSFGMHLSSRHDSLSIMCDIFVLSFFLGFVLFIILFVLKKIYLSYLIHSRETSDYSFSKKYNLNTIAYYQFPDSLKKEEEEDNDLSLVSGCKYSNYDNCIVGTINGVSYSMNERILYPKNGISVYEFICIAKHKKSAVPDFIIRQKHWLADSFLGFFNNYISFPEDSVFSRQYMVRGIQPVLENSVKEDIKNFFTDNIRDVFVKNHVFEATYCSCDSHTFKVKVSRRLKESEKEKIFNICNALFGEDLETNH